MPFSVGQHVKISSCWGLREFEGQPIGVWFHGPREGTIMGYYPETGLYSIQLDPAYHELEQYPNDKGLRAIGVELIVPDGQEEIANSESV